MAFIENWKNQAKQQILLARPDLDEKYLDKYLDKIIKDKAVDPPCVVDNNYRSIKVNSTLMGIIDWIEKDKPILGGYGVFFKNQHDAFNMVGATIRKFLDSRTWMKNKMKEILKEMGSDCYEYRQEDRLQGNEKRNANSIYGASGAKVSIFYNLYTAASTTGTAQSLISTSCASFEMFMAGATKFFDTDECLNFIMRVMQEKHRISMDGITLVSKEKCLKRLCKNFFSKKKCNKEVIDRALSNLTPEDISRIYYKNNLYEFTANCKAVIYHLRKAMLETETFRAPKEKLMTPELKDDLDIVWAYYKEFVQYKHPVYNRIYRLKTSKRKSVLVIDTDSNMVLIHKWIKMIMNNFVDERNTQPTEELLFTAASIICVFITKMNQSTLNQYCKLAHVPSEFHHQINMKNEFFFETLVTTAVKKNYLSSVLLREGLDMKGKMDIKGLSFTKSIVSPTISKLLKQIVKDDILGKKHIDHATILKKLNLITDKIHESLKAGKLDFAKPASVKAMEHYSNPLSQQGVRGAMVWNAAYPENPIELPDNVQIVKVKMLRESDVEALKEVEPEIWQNLHQRIYNNPNPSIAKNGIGVIAIPEVIHEIPKWIIPYIDVDTITEDNTRSFFPVLSSLSFDILNTRSNNKTYSNMIKF